MIGELNQRARILAPVLTPDGGGGYSESWNAVATVWVRVEAVSGDDVFGQDAPESRMRYRVVLRRLAAAAAGQHVVIGARTLRVHGVSDEGPRSDVITLLCEELP